MQIPPNYQQYQPNFQPYPPAPKPRNNNSILAIIALAVAGLALILAIIASIGAFSNKSAASSVSFSVENFEQKKIEYEYLEETAYSGEGNVYTDDHENTYLVVLKLTITSGGGADSNKTSYQMVQVVNGKGEFSTYDYGDNSNYSEPKYKFDIVGYVKLEQPED
jgi:hypothetical protein